MGWALSACNGPASGPAPAAGQVAAEYRLQPGDQIEVRLAGAPEYGGAETVGPDGNLAAPGLPEPVYAQGLTVPALSARIGGFYARAGLLKAPDVAISLRGFGSQQAYVGGEVRRPGLLSLPQSGRTVLQAVMAGGGPLSTAAMQDVAVLRTFPDGHARLLHADLARALDGIDPAQNLELQAQDVVIVPKTAIARWDVWVDQYVRSALPVPVETLLLFANGPIPLH